MNLEELYKISENVKKGQKAFGSARQLLQCFGYSRRGAGNNPKIKAQLDNLGIITFPPFDTTWLDEEFAFKRKDEPQPQSDTNTHVQADPINGAADADKFVKEPAFRVGRLKSANKKPLSVNTNTKLKEAATIMMMNDYSQLPVIDGKTLKGVINWKTIGNRLIQNCDGDEVRFFMEKATEISSDESIFTAIELIKQYGFTLVRGKGMIVGIITTYDLAAEFRDFVEPFLLLASIENQIRTMLGAKLSLTDIKAAKDPADTEREVTCISDLSFGEYMRTFQNPELWDKLSLNIDRKHFTNKLDEIRNIRNEVMHFAPDPLDNEEVLTLWNFSVFLDTLTKKEFSNK